MDRHAASRPPPPRKRPALRACRMRRPPSERVVHRYARRLRTDHGVLAIAFAYILADYARREACAIEAGMWKAVEEHIAASLHRAEPGLTDVSPRAGEPRPRPAPPGPVEAPFAPSTA